MSTRRTNQGIDMKKIALSTAAVLALSLVAAAALSGCGGSDTPDAKPVVANQLLLEDPHSGKIAAFPTADPDAGTAFASHVVASVPGATGAMAFDAAHDFLYVAITDSSTNTASIQVFEEASIMTTGKPWRTLTFEPGIQAFSVITKLVWHAPSDTLWVYGRNQSGEIALAGGSLVKISSASGFSGQVSAADTMTVRIGSASSSFDYDAGRDVAYATGVEDLSGNLLPGVSVFSAASTNFAGSGLLQPTGTIAIPGAVDVAHDATRDILYVADAQQGLWVVQQASSATPVLVGPIAMAQVDSVSVDVVADRLVVGAGTSAYVFDHASALTATSAFPSAAVTTNGGVISSAGFNS